MSQKKEKKEDGTGKVLTGIAVGVAVAAASAAIGYFGRQIVNSWQASQEVEKEAAEKNSELSCAKKMEKDDSFESSANRREPARRPINVDNRSAISPVMAPVSVKQTPLSLHEQLMDYYYTYVDIQKETMAEAYKVANELRSVVSNHLRDPKLLQIPMLKVGDLVPFGSITEGLGVIRPNKFNIMVPVKLQSDCRIKSSDSSADQCSGLVYLEVQADDAGTFGCDSWCSANHCVQSNKLATSLLVAFQQACYNTRFNCTVALNNSSIVLTVHHLNGQMWTSVNFVPAIIIGNKLYLPNQTNSALSDSSDVPSDLSGSCQWLASYARQEQWSVDRFDSDIKGHRMVVKILKAIRLNHLEQFGQVSAYHIKTVLFHVLEDLPDSSDWQESAVSERVIDLLVRLVQALNDHHLPHYFEHSVNLFSSIPKDECVKLARFIEKKLGYNDIHSLLARDY